MPQVKDPRSLIALVATLFLLIFTLYRTVSTYKSLNYAKKVGHFGYIISFSILATMYAMQYFSPDIKVPFLVAAAILLAPLLLYQYLQRREKDK